MTTDEKPVFPLDDNEWERLMFCVIDGVYSDEDNREACAAIEILRKERTEILRRLRAKEKK